jgi:hypothetical protein
MPPAPAVCSANDKLAARWRLIRQSLNIYSHCCIPTTRGLLPHFAYIECDVTQTHFDAISAYLIRTNTNSLNCSAKNVTSQTLSNSKYNKV